MGKLAYGYGLPHLPRMPELKALQNVDFDAIDVEPTSIPYKDKNREKQRLIKLEQTNNKEPACREKRQKKRKAISDAWSKRKEKMKRKGDRKKINKMNERRSNKRKFDRLNDTEIDEISNEARLVKKLKSGKISKVEFEIRVNDDDLL